jgi:hypothetical protein
MNERIRELAVQAGFSIAGNPEYIHAMDYDGMCTDELKKFAELIIRECADVAVKFHLAHPYSVEYQIKKHFGVEE